MASFAASVLQSVPAYRVEEGPTGYRDMSVGPGTLVDTCGVEEGPTGYSDISEGLGTLPDGKMTAERTV